jgi:molybdopterin-guanine dinucleotide biosynthesis protein A
MKLAAVLLAGGESRRMGRDKATLPFASQPLWERQLALLRDLSPDSLFVSARRRPEWLPAGALLVVDPVPPRGPLGGIAAALAAESATHVLALAIDMPAMTTGHLAELWRAASLGRGVIPWLDGEPQPLPAIYPAEAWPIAHQLLAGPDVSLSTFAEALIAAGHAIPYRITSSEAHLYANYNSPADLPSHAAHHPSPR